MKVAVVVMFLDEEQHLAATLESLANQTRVPDRLLLVDDGSADRSADIARAYVGRFPHAELLQRPRRAVERDRLVSASVWTGFQWAVAQLDEACDVVAKLDADLELPPDTLAEIEARFEADPELGLTGPYLSEMDDSGDVVRIAGRPEHVAGAVKFYRRACYDEVYPLPPLLNLDMIDEVKARSRGWRTESFAAADGDPLHRRIQGSRDGSLRAFRRWGVGDYQSGSHPLLVAFVGGQRMRQRPVVLGGLNYFGGWVGAAIRRVPRFDAELRAFRRREQLARVRQRVREVVRAARRLRAPTR